jgi:hypothetical protein
MPKFRSKPVIVDAVQFRATRNSNEVPPGVHPANPRSGGRPYVVTAQGQVSIVEEGDWIITEFDGEGYRVVSHEVFDRTYERVEE